MKILIACEESQAVCKEMRRLGHEAYSADIQDCSGGHPEWHIKGDVLPLINGRYGFVTCDGVRHEIPGRWDMLIAHPPCTYLSNAGAARLFRHIDGKSYAECERLKKGLMAKDFFLEFLNADVPRIAVENPIPSLIYCLPKYTQIIQPYEHGHPYSKKTCLWLRGLPPLGANRNSDRGHNPLGIGREQKRSRESAQEKRHGIPRSQNPLQNIPGNRPCNGRTVGWEVRGVRNYIPYAIAALVGFHLRWTAAHLAGADYSMNGADIIVAIACIIMVWSFKGAFLPKKKKNRS